LRLDPGPLDWPNFALRFSAFAPGVDSVIVGTSRPENLERNVRALEDGPLPADLLAGIEAAWREYGGSWGGEV
ncbi:MAG: aldo/keto reductase, partial [Deinococcus sp.]